MASGPVVGMVWQGLDAVKTGRAMLGATNPLASAVGTIRGDYALAVGRNICHGSDSVENAEKEIALYVLHRYGFTAVSLVTLLTLCFFSWFPEGVTQYTNVAEPWIYE